MVDTDEQLKKPRINFTGPAGLYKKVMKAARADGWEEAQVHRLCWYMGAQVFLKERQERLEESKET